VVEISRLGDDIGVLAVNILDQGEFGDAINHGDQRSLMVLANHRIDRPIPNTGLLFDNRGALVNADPVFDLRALIL